MERQVKKVVLSAALAFVTQYTAVPFPAFAMKEWITGPELLVGVRQDLLYLATTEVRYDDRGNVVPQSHISKRLGWCAYSVEDGTYAGEPVRIVRWYAANNDRDLEHQFTLDRANRLLRQVSRSTRPSAREAIVVTTPDSLQVRVTDQGTTRSFEAEFPDLSPFRDAFVPFKQGPKQAWLYDAFENKMEKFEIRVASTWTQSWSGITYRGTAYSIGGQKLYLTEQLRTFRVEFTDRIGLEPSVEYLRSKKS